MPFDPIQQLLGRKARGQRPTFQIQRGRGHVVLRGKWQHPVYGEMEISSADICEFLQNFKNKVRKDLPITAVGPISHKFITYRPACLQIFAQS